MKQFALIFLLLGLVALGHDAFIIENTTLAPSTSTPEVKTTSAPKEPTVAEIVNAKIPNVLKNHQIPPGSKLVDLKPALANVTKFKQCYEPGIVGIDLTLNIYGNMTVEQIVTYYFEKLPTVINVQNGSRRIGALIHSILLITDLVIECDNKDTKDPIGLTTLSCLPVDEQVSMVGR